MNPTSDPTPCPFLREVVMLYCDACPQHKLLPRDHVVSMGPCSTADYTSCPLYREIARWGTAGREREVRS